MKAMPLIHFAAHCTLPPHQGRRLLVGERCGGEEGWLPEGKGGEWQMSLFLHNIVLALSNTLYIEFYSVGVYNTKH